MAAKLTRPTHKITMQLHLVTESCAICSSHSMRSVRKLLDTTSYAWSHLHEMSGSSRNGKSQVAIMQWI